MAAGIGCFASEGSCRTRRGWAAPNAAASEASGGRILSPSDICHLDSIDVRWFPYSSLHGAFWLYLSDVSQFPSLRCWVCAFLHDIRDLYFKLWDALSSCCANLQWDVAARLRVLWAMMIWHNLTKTWNRRGSLPFQCSCGCLDKRFLASDSTVQIVQFSSGMRSVVIPWPAAAWPSSFKNRASKRCTARCQRSQPKSYLETRTLGLGQVWSRYRSSIEFLCVLWAKLFRIVLSGDFRGVVHPFIMPAHCQFSRASGTRWHFKAADGEVELRLQGVQNQINLRIIATFYCRRVRIIHETNLRPNILRNRCRQRHDATSSMSAQLLFRNIPSACCAVSTWRILDMFQELKPVGTAGL